MLLLVAGFVLITPCFSWAQKSTKVYRVGYLSLASSSDRLLAAILNQLRNYGYVEGQNLATDSRYAEGDPELLPKLAVELVKNDPDVILVNGTSVTLAAHRATSTIPIIMAPATDPVLAGVLTSLSHPGGNVTGVMINIADITAKRIQLLKEIIPAAHRIGAFYPGEARANPVNAFDLWLFARAGLQPSRQP